jgi:hypothetical protein
MVFSPVGAHALPAVFTPCVDFSQSTFAAD